MPSVPGRRRTPSHVVWALALALSLVVATACTDSDPSAGPAEPAAATTSTDAAGASTSTTSAAPAPVDRCSTAGWTREERIATTVFAALTSAEPAQLDEVLAAGAGGVMVSTAAVPLAAEGTVAARVDTAEIPPLVAVDEEGGRVQRLRDVLGAIPSARETARTMSPFEIEASAASHATLMRDLGITMDFAPVVDVSTQPDGGPIGDRSFAGDPATVVATAGAFAAGLARAGVLPTLKHFPGHGRAGGDSHDQAVSTPPLAELDADLEPYRVIPDSTTVAVMVGHLGVPGLTGDQPASLSPAAVDGLLRTDLGFDGLVVTDDLAGMDAIAQRWSTEEAAVLALVAGNDMVLVPATAMGSVTAAIDAAVDDGRLDAERLVQSADRVLAARLGPGTCPA